MLLSAWPICSEPVTLGGGMTIVYGSASAAAPAPARNASASAQRLAISASTEPAS